MISHPSLVRALRRALAALYVATSSASFAAGAAEPSPVSHGLFTDVRVYRPAGAAGQFVMLVTEDVTPSERERIERAKPLVGAA